MSLDHRRSRAAWELHHNSQFGELADRPDTGFYIGMLLDDLGNRQYSYECHLEFDSDNVGSAERFVASFLVELSQYGSEPAEHLFWNLVESVCYETLIHRRCTAEVFLAVDEHDDESQTRKQASHPRLSILPGWSLKRSRARTWQVDPKENTGWRSLEEATLVEFKLDQRLAKSLDRAYRDLAALDESPVDRQVLMSMDPPIYDFELHQRHLHELAARATSGIGWDGRGLFMKRATDSFKMFRELRFLRTWLAIVSSVQVALNDAILLAGDMAGPRSIEVKGLPAIAEVDDALQAVCDGTESLDSIRNRLIHPRYA